MLKIFLVEDEFIVREGIKIILTGKHMGMNSAERQAMEKWHFQ